MVDAKSVRVIFRLYFGKIHSFASDFISEESFRPEEFFEDDFQAIRVSRAVGGPRVFKLESLVSMSYILPLHSCLHKGNHDLKLWRNVVADGSADTRTPGKLSNDDSEMARLRKVCYVAIVLTICASHASIDFGEVCDFDVCDLWMKLDD